MILRKIRFGVKVNLYRISFNICISILAQASLDNIANVIHKQDQKHSTHVHNIYTNRNIY